MSNFRDLIARMAIDAEFARHARANPDAVARQYQLSQQESEQLRGLADAAASAGPTALGARLSKMGGLTTSISSHLVLTGPDTDGDGIPDWTDTDDDNDGIADGSDLQLAPRPVILDPVLVLPSEDEINPMGDPDGDGLPNILDNKNHSADPYQEGWGDHDRDGVPNMFDPDAPDDYKYQLLPHQNDGDYDYDGIKNDVDLKPLDPNTGGEPLGDKDGDGIPNYLDKFNFPFGDIVGPPLVLNPDLGIGDPATPPAGDPPAPPAPPSGEDTPPAPPEPDPVPSTPDAPPAAPAGDAGAPAQQPILLAEDVLAQPVAVPPANNDGGGLGVGTTAVIVGGIALAGGAVAGGVAGKMLSDRNREEDV